MGELDTQSAPEALLGGKAWGLQRLKNLGVQVPPWFTLSSQYFSAHLKHHNLEEQFAACLKSITQASAEQDGAWLQRLLLKTTLSDSLCELVARELSKLGADDVAVRSSMAGEDSASTSYAGQLSSFLHLRTVIEICEAIKQCWASSLSSRVLKYRLLHESKLSLPKIAVIIQRMIAGQVSGVLFTAHPSTGVRHHCLVSACFGLAQGVVDGSCDADEYVVDTLGQIISSNIAHKENYVVGDENGVGTRLMALPLEQQTKSCLAPGQLKLLVKSSLFMARTSGEHLDFEWTIKDNELYFLQMRPITALPVAPNIDGHALVFDNSNIQESYCGVTTPLTFSFASHAYAQVYRQTMTTLGLKADVVVKKQELLDNLLGLINGRIYYNINNWYQGLSLLPSFGRNKADMEAMMGLDEPVDFVASSRLNWSASLRLVPVMLKTYTTLLWRFYHLPVAVERFTRNFEISYRQLDRKVLSSLTFSELMGRLEFLNREMLGKWHTPIINDFFVMMSSGALKRLVTKTMGEKSQEVLTNLMRGEEGIKSTEQTHELMRLSQLIAADKGLATLFSANKSAQNLEEALKIHYQTFWQQIEIFVESYGDRCAGELKLESISYREDRSLLFDMLRLYAQQSPSMQSVQQERKYRQAAENQVNISVGFIAQKRFQRALNHARSSIKNRENMRLMRTRMFGLYRDIYLHVGRCLVEAKKIKERRDIFYLTKDEIRCYYEGRSVTGNLAELIEVRRTEFQGYLEQEPPHRVNTRGPVYHGNNFLSLPRRSGASTDVLNGTGCYPGIVSAPICVMLTPTNPELLSGKILVTLRTDPGWAPLFPFCKGLIVERGSTLSHSAIVARELGIPAIVGVKDLLFQLKNGEKVTMNGASGSIIRDV